MGRSVSATDETDEIGSCKEEGGSWSPTGCCDVCRTGGCRQHRIGWRLTAALSTMLYDQDNTHTKNSRVLWQRFFVLSRYAALHVAHYTIESDSAVGGWFSRWFYTRRKLRGFKGLILQVSSRWSGAAYSHWRFNGFHETDAVDVSDECTTVTHTHTHV